MEKHVWYESKYKMNNNNPMLDSTKKYGVGNISGQHRELRYMDIVSSSSKMVMILSLFWTIKFFLNPFLWEIVAADLDTDVQVGWSNCTGNTQWSNQTHLTKDISNISNIKILTQRNCICSLVRVEKEILLELQSNIKRWNVIRNTLK